MVDTNWGLIADKRINQLIKLEAVMNQEDYKRELRRILSKPDANGRFTGINILKAGRKGKNKGLISFQDIVEQMYKGDKSSGTKSAKTIIEEKQQKIKEFLKSESVSYKKPDKIKQFHFLYSITEVWYKHTSKNNNVYWQRQFKDKKGRFTKNPLT